MIEARTTEAHHHLAVGAGLPLNIAEDHLWIEKENDGVAISQRVDQAIMVHQKMGVGRLQVVEAEVVPLLLDIGMTTLQDVIEIIGEIEAEAEIDVIILIIILAIILCGTHANMEAIRGEDLLLLLLLLACSLVTETEIEIEMINAENESEILNMNMIMNKIAIENTGRQQLKSEKRIFPQRLYLHSNRNRNLSSSSYNNSSNISLSNSSNISLSLSDRCRRLKRVI
jgi:hypothetical protein